jgi:lysophospholipase L1-like esterase
VLKRENPEAAIVMIGTNDTGPNGAPESYAANLEKLLKMIMDAHCIPILNTIPPKRGCLAGVEKTNQIIRDLAAKRKLPLVDYHAAILDRAPDGKWDGTLISEDGVHPSGGENQVFTTENLAKCGYALRNYVTFLKYREVFFRVLRPEQAGRP